MSDSIQDVVERVVPPRISLESARVLTGAALQSLLAERIKQVEAHGRTIAGDQVTNDRAALVLAGASYANAAVDQLTATTAARGDVSKPDPMTWPWDARHWRPEDPRTNLVKAAALIWAAIDRLDHEKTAPMRKDRR